MDTILTSLLNKNGIYSYGTIPFSKCLPVKQWLYDECTAKGMKSVIIFAVPYKTGKTSDDAYKMSAYARVFDYHKRFEQIFLSLIKDLENNFPGFKFVSYADNSPINEKIAAANAGIGVIGNNTLLITNKYGSYVFLGSVVTDMETGYTFTEAMKCKDCGKCVSACPTGALTASADGKINGFDYEKCMSYISQKKEKTAIEDELIVRNGAVWGCDICQEVCPMNKDKSLTDDGYFTDSFIKELSYNFIQSMSEEEFIKYPFSWRKKDVILHNLSLLENNKTI